MVLRHVVLVALASTAAATVAAQNIQPGTANGVLTIDGVSAKLTHATRTTRANAFDDTAQDTVIVLSDRPLTVEEAGNEAGLLARAQRGELVTMAVRFDERRGRSKLFNVAINFKGLPQTVLLPDVWFQYTYKAGVGLLKLENREFDGRTYSSAVDFAVTVPAETTVAAAPAATSTPLPPPSQTDADRKAATALLIETLQEGDEVRALAIVKLGIDPDGRDQKMSIPLINWAVLMCQPLIVKELVELKADLRHERLPGMTLLSEAVAACPEAVPYLRAGGAK